MEVIRVIARSLTFSIVFCGLANGTTLQAMDQPFPERPALFIDFVLPSRAKHFFLNLWIANPHVTNSWFVGLEDPKWGSQTERRT